MDILLATNNQGKVARYKKLLTQAGLGHTILTPQELNIDPLEVEESGTTLLQNAELKARAYFGQTSLPVLSNDTGFFVEGMGLVEAPKRIALNGQDERSLSQEQITQLILQFWKDLATNHGGQVDAAWVDAYVLLHPDGQLHQAEARRKVLLTNQEFGQAHPQMPVRALYYSKATNKPAIQHTDAEETLEMQPIITALASLFQ